jgi:hypothetical protein
VSNSASIALSKRCGSEVRLGEARLRSTLRALADRNVARHLGDPIVARGVGGSRIQLRQHFVFPLPPADRTGPHLGEVQYGVSAEGGGARAHRALRKTAASGAPWTRQKRLPVVVQKLASHDPHMLLRRGTIAETWQHARDTGQRPPLPNGYQARKADRRYLIRGLCQSTGCGNKMNIGRCPLWITWGTDRTPPWTPITWSASPTAGSRASEIPASSRRCPRTAGSLGSAARRIPC